MFKILFRFVIFVFHTKNFYFESTIIKQNLVLSSTFSITNINHVWVSRTMTKTQRPSYSTIIEYWITFFIGHHVIAFEICQ